MFNSPSTPVLIGREPQLAVLRDFIARVPAGSGGALLIRGDAGAGKTRLVQELAAETRAAAMRVAVGGCVAFGDQPLRHAALIELLRNATRDRPNDTASQGIAGLSTEQLLERLLALVDDVGAPDALVLVVEDLHWADRGTCEILTVLARHIGDRPVGVVLTCREELPRDHHVRMFLAELSRSELVTPVAVPALTAAEGASLIAALLGDVDAVTIARVFERSGGSPLIIEELCAHDNAAAGDVHGPIRDIMLGRFWQLSDAAREVVRAVAVAGAPVDEAELATVVAVDAKTFTNALREALDLRVLLLQDGAVKMRHVLMAEAIYGDLLAIERVDLHARWATARPDAPAALVAHHWYEAGDDERAFTASLVAAREATQAMAFDVAHRYYQQVLTLWDHVDDAASRAEQERSDVALQAAETANWAGDPGNAVDIVDATLAASPTLDDATTSVLLERRAWYLLRQGANEAARTAYDAALAALPRGADPATRARVLAGSVRAWERARDYDHALALAREAVSVARDSRVDAEIGPAQYMLGRILLEVGEVDSAIIELERASVAAEEVLNPVLLAIARLEHGDALARQGRLAEAVPAARAAAERLRLRGHTEPHALLALAAGAALLHRLGRPEEGQAIAIEILEIARTPVIVALGHLLAGAFDVEALRLASAREHLETARILAAPLLDGRVGAALASARVDLGLAERNVESAASALDEGIEKVVHSGDDEALGHLALSGLRVEAERDVSALGRGSERTRRRRDETIAGYERQLDAVLAGADPRAARPDLDAIRVAWTAERHRLDGVHDPDAWVAAADAWDAASWPRWAAYSALRHAEALARTRAPERAIASAFRAADDRAVALQSALLRAPIAALAERAGVTLSTPVVADAAVPHEPAHDRLTPREREVLELVMAGATNRQIASRLFISEKTASVHVSRILTKLGVANRQEAAAVARRTRRTRRP